MLATVGVVVTAGAVAAFLIAVFDVEWRRAMLAGSVVAAADAAAVFSLLGQHGIGLADRLKGTLEVESGAKRPDGHLPDHRVREMLRLDNAVLGWPSDTSWSRWGSASGSASAAAS